MNTHNPFDPINQKLDQIQADLEGLKSKPDPEPPTSEKYLTTEQVCELLSVSRVTLWNWQKSEILNPLRIGNLKRYKLSQIENFTASKKEGV